MAIEGKTGILSPRSNGSIFFSIWVVLLLLNITQVMAETALSGGSSAEAVVMHHSAVTPGAMSHLAGMVSANLTAGDGNVQQNSAALASSPGYSVAGAEASQFSDFLPANFYQSLSASIGAGALDDALGVVMINQSSGAGNAQFNGAAIAIGGLGAEAYVQLNSEALGAQSASGKSGSSGATVNSEGVYLDPDAFSNARGVMMINQAAGNNNATANSFTLSVGP